MSAAAIISKLGMQPHPEGGWYVETFRDSATDARGRSVGSAIYFLLEAGQSSWWHSVDATEIWHWHAGSPLQLKIATAGNETTFQLGPNVLEGQTPQAIVPAHAWQAARSLGDWTLVGCTVSPGFLFDTFVLAPPDWTPALS
jgi:predicted cupin superfamily sugar epimerase